MLYLEFKTVLMVSKMSSFISSMFLIFAKIYSHSTDFFSAKNINN